MNNKYYEKYYENIGRSKTENQSVTLLLKDYLKEQEAIYKMVTKKIDQEKGYLDLSDNNKHFSFLFNGNGIKNPFSNFENVNFERSRLDHSKFSNYNLEKVNFSNANLYKTEFKNSNIDRVNFSNANLYKADFSDSYIIATKFEKANLYKTDFSNASFFGVDFDSADLYGANFIGAIFRNTVFNKANIEGMIIDDGEGNEYIIGLKNDENKDIEYNLIKNPKEVNKK